jgi:hypothetical protein
MKKTTLAIILLAVFTAIIGSTKLMAQAIHNNKTNSTIGSNTQTKLSSA